MEVQPEMILSFQAALSEAAEARKNGRVLPTRSALAHAVRSLPPRLPNTGIGLEATLTHLLTDIVPALSCSSLSPRYFGFITGGVTPAAQAAESIVSTFDQNLQVHLPSEVVATDVENKALAMLVELFRLHSGPGESVWNGTFTTGSSVSNLLGLACGQEYILEAKGKESVGSVGLLAACTAAGIDEVQILTTMQHPSILKASSLIGVGKNSVKQVGKPDEPWSIDLQSLEEALKMPRMATIVSICCGEVNTGQFATNGDILRQIRALCDIYGAWLHVDAAFGIFARILDSSPEFAAVRQGCEGIDVADSITGDAHKLLNVPYDCGFFFSRHQNVTKRVFETPNLAYFATARDESIASLLDVGVQNSPRFRALPVYASLAAYGSHGHQEILRRQIRFARSVAAFILEIPDFELLPRRKSLSDEKLLESVYIIVLFRACDEMLNQSLLKRVNEGGDMYLAGAMWKGKPACRMAVSNWRIEVERDGEIVRNALKKIVNDAKQDLIEADESVMKSSHRSKI